MADTGEVGAGGTAASGPVGFVGVGNMGGRMTRRLMAAGHDVLAVDASTDRVAECGARPAGSLAELAAECDVIMLSLPDSSVIEQVIRGDDGLAAAARTGQVIVDLSTADPRSTVRLHDDLAARGVQFLDAGISGGAAAADKGTLTLMVGVVISLFQALTQIQEMTLVFVPKILAIFVAMLIALPFMGDVLQGHMTRLAARIMGG